MLDDVEIGQPVVATIDGKEKRGLVSGTLSNRFQRKLLIDFGGYKMAVLEINCQPLITCWCGAVGTYEEMFSDAYLERSCGGTGQLTCFCGGDFCVCHNHGSDECFGCDDCDGDDEHGWYDDEFEYENWSDDDH